MSINKARLNRFRDEMEALQKGLTFDASYEIIQAKIVDFLAKSNITDKSSLGEIRRGIESAFHPEFTRFVKDIFTTYNDVLDLVNDQYSDLGLDIERDLTDILAYERISKTKLGQFEDDEIQRIAKDIRKGLRKKEDHEAIAKRLKTDTGNRVKYYANTIAKTLVKGYGQTTKMEKSRIAEIEWFEYVGFKRTTTRDFCLKLLDGNSHYHIDEIMAMKNDNLEPVIQYGGGWDCIHFFEPDPFYKGRKAA